MARFASCEPLLGALDVRPWLGGGLDWVIAGGESGPRARPMHPDWARSLRDQCQVACVAFFFKQWGSWSPMPRTGEDGLMVLTGSRDVANDGTVYRPGDLTYDPPGPRYRKAIRAGHDRAALTAMYPASKKSSRELDGRIWDEFPTPAGVS